MNELIAVKSVNQFGITVSGIRIGDFSGPFKEGVSFPVSLRDSQDNEKLSVVVPFTKEQYDAWTTDKAAEDIILSYLNLQRA